MPATAMIEHARPESEQRMVNRVACSTDVYFAAHIETDGSIPGVYSILSFALVYAGRFDGGAFERPDRYDKLFYRELRPISKTFEEETLALSGLDRDRLLREGANPAAVMDDAAAWIRSIAGDARPILVTFRPTLDWCWLYWYFVRFAADGSPFDGSGCFDIRTAFALKAGLPVSGADRSTLPAKLRGTISHPDHPVDGAVEQAEIFARVFAWSGAEADV